MAAIIERRPTPQKRKRLDAPTITIGGTKDAITNWRETPRLDKEPRAELVGKLDKVKRGKTRMFDGGRTKEV